MVLDKSRLLESMAEALVAGSYRGALVRLLGTTALYSAFINNTAVVASLIGPLRGNRRHAASRLLLPMCYAATLGGTLTLVGTSTNLLVNSFLVGRGMPELHLFDLLPVGALLLMGGIAFMLLAYPRLLPDRPADEDAAQDYFVEATVQPGSPLIGRSVEAGGLRNLGHLFLSEIVRGDRLIAPVEPTERLLAGDVLVFAGDVTRLDLLTGFAGLKPLSEHADLPLDNLVEVVVAAHSAIARRTVRDADFRSQFDAAVVGVRRGSERLGGSIGSAFGLFDFLKGLLVLLAAFVATGLTRWPELRRNMPYELIVIIGSALVISEVMIATGSANLLAAALLGGAAQLGPHAALAIVLVVTWILTELMSNNAAAALAFPVAIGVAEQLGLPAMPFVMAVLYGASCSFSTPFGYQTNLMVMSPGRYMLSDYLRCGLPLGLVYMAIALVSLWFSGARGCLLTAHGQVFLSAERLRNWLPYAAW